MSRKILALPVHTLAFISLLLSVVAQAVDTERVLYSFNGVNAGLPYSTLTSDASGNLYGASEMATASKYGAIFRLAKGPSGHWNMTVLYEFRGAADGGGPNGGLVFDSSGNLYGTTYAKGGVANCSCGTVFELTPTPSGPWKETTLYSFKGGSDGALPEAGVVFDVAGNLYGTTWAGGQYQVGTVFHLSPNSSGGWTENVIYTFQGGSDGLAPSTGLIFDMKGNLYGTIPTEGNGACASGGCGAVYELTPNSGSWTKTTLYAFTGGTDGGYPSSTLLFDGSGNLFGTAVIGGDLSTCDGTGCGAIFKLSPNSVGLWTESTLYAFTGGNDGIGPQGALIFNSAGSLYGVTLYGGSTCGCGAVFKLSPSSGGSWVENTLHTFTDGRDGGRPSGGLILGRNNALYGPAFEGGTYNFGAIYQIFP